MFIYLL